MKVRAARSSRGENPLRRCAPDSRERANPLSLLPMVAASSPEGGAGTPSSVTERVAVPLGKVDANAVSRRKGYFSP